MSEDTPSSASPYSRPGRRHRQRSVGEIVGIAARIVGRSDIGVGAYGQSVVRTGRCAVSGSVLGQRLSGTDLRSTVEEVHRSRWLDDPSTPATVAVKVTSYRR